MSRWSDQYAAKIISRQVKTNQIIVDPVQPEAQTLIAAAKALRKGELVAFPTETVYGLGANALDARAVNAIFLAKGRPADNPLIVHVSSIDDLKDIADCVSPLAKTLFAAFAPGPLTLVMKKSPAVSDSVTAGLDTVAVRIPSHPVARLLIELAGVPVAAPSANRSGRPSPTRAWHVSVDLNGCVSWIIDAGESVLGLESTVLDISGDTPHILRPGSISRQRIEEVIAPLGYTCSGSEADQLACQADEPARSPGMKYRHYAPRASVWMIDDPDPVKKAERVMAKLYEARQAGLKAGLFCSRSLLSKTGDSEKMMFSELDLTSEYEGCYPLQRTAVRFTDDVPVIFYGDLPDATAAGAALFAALRLLDCRQLDWIIAEGLTGYPDSEAYMNRLVKAAAEYDAQPARSQKRLLFVCTGNTCRSPMAEYLFNDRCQADEWLAGSAGLAAVPGQQASIQAQQILMERYQLDLSGHRARQVSKELVEQSDLILTMTDQHREWLKRSFPCSAHKIKLIAEFADASKTQISDPFGGSLADYKQTADQIQCLIDKLLPLLPCSGRK